MLCLLLLLLLLLSMVGVMLPGEHHAIDLLGDPPLDATIRRAALRQLLHRVEAIQTRLDQHDDLALLEPFIRPRVLLRQAKADERLAQAVGAEATARVTRRQVELVADFVPGAGAEQRE